jgi:hypothetical protein
MEVDERPGVAGISIFLGVVGDCQMQGKRPCTYVEWQRGCGTLPGPTQVINNANGTEWLAEVYPVGDGGFMGLVAGEGGCRNARLSDLGLSHRFRCCL